MTQGKSKRANCDPRRADKAQPCRSPALAFGVMLTGEHASTTWRTEIVLRMLALRLSFRLPLHYSHRDLEIVLMLAEKGQGKRIADSQDWEGARG